jgi:membrane protein DedA with SNARE-associated domain
MTDFLIQYIEAAAQFAPTWGLLLVLVFMTVESSFIPFPSEVVMIPAGFLAARGAMLTAIPELDVALAVLAGILGSLAGALVNYYLAARLGSPFLERYGRYFFLPPPKLHRAEELFRRYGAGATFFCRLLPAIRQLISLPAGLSGMKMSSFLLWTGLGAGIWVIVLAAIGYVIGHQTSEMSYADLVHSGKAMASGNLVWLAPLCVLGMVAYVLISNRIMKVDQPA